MKYAVILVLAISVAACGIRRDLKMPKDEPASQATQQNSEATPAAISPLD